MLPGIARDDADHSSGRRCFDDGTKLVTVHEPIRPAEGADADLLEPGAITAADGDIDLNAGRRACVLKPVNTGDRPMQVGSHFHFFEVNSALEFDRAAPPSACGLIFPPAPRCGSNPARARK